MYRHSSGALVFGAGTIQWPWGLDATHDRGSGVPVDVRMQQATANLLADMSALPATLQPGLTSPTESSDAGPPSSTITSPSTGATLVAGQAVTVTGTASDTAGMVGGVEVSTDGGTTWLPAQGRDTWTYNWTPSSAGSVTLKTRAVDDSGNLETPSAGTTVTVAGQTCPCSIWSNSTTPATVSDPDTAAVELGVKFRTDVDGFVTGLRFYKGSANTGTHVGHLWTSGGTLLAQATFSGESASGWQQVSLASPAAVTAGTTYVASYHAPNGRYAADSGYFTGSAVDNPPLHSAPRWPGRAEQHLQVRRERLLPRPVVQRHELLGGRRFRHGRGPGQHRADRSVRLAW